MKVTARILFFSLPMEEVECTFYSSASLDKYIRMMQRHGVAHELIWRSDVP